VSVTHQLYPLDLVPEICRVQISTVVVEIRMAAQSASLSRVSDLVAAFALFVLIGGLCGTIPLP
jgi:hypothetical protein